MTDIELHAHVVRRLKQFSSVLWLIGSSIGGGGELEGRFSRDPLPVFSAGGTCEQFWHGQGCPLFDVAQPAFPMLTMASSTLQVPCRMVFERLSWHVICTSHTSSNLWPFLLISAWMLFVLLVMIFLFSVLTSFSYAVTLSTSQLVRSWSLP